MKIDQKDKIEMKKKKEIQDQIVTIN